MVDFIEHFVYGTASRLENFCANVEAAGFKVNSFPGGVIVYGSGLPDRTTDQGFSFIENLALEHGLTYDGSGRALLSDWFQEERGLDIQRSIFSDRTGIKTGEAFSLPMPSGRFAHAVYLGSNADGYLLLDVSTLVTNSPARPEEIRDAPRLYRQPILVWHTSFIALRRQSEKPLLSWPHQVVFRTGVGWPLPEEIEMLERRFGVTNTHTPTGWNSLLISMVVVGERLPGMESYNLVKADIDKLGLLEITFDFDFENPLNFGNHATSPMPWDPTTIDEVLVALDGGPNMIAIRDKVT